MEGINWVVFTQEEKLNIKKALDKGDYKLLTNIVDEMTPEKEIQIQKIVTTLSAKDQDYESKVRGEMESNFLNKNVADLTPEEEMEWQKKLDAEKEMMMNKNVEVDDNKEQILDQILQEEDAQNIEEVKEETLVDSPEEVKEEIINE